MSDNNDRVDKYDYLMGAVFGVLAGLMDVFFVGTPGDSMLGNWTDARVNDVVMGYAKIEGFTPKGGVNDLQNAIQFLERRFPVNYDQATSMATGGMVDHLSMKNHHLKSLAHQPDVIGWAVSILDQFMGTSTFLSNGKLITIRSDSTLEGGNFISKLFCGTHNWFGHLMSDVAGSSGAIGQGHRGSGLPLPFYSLFQTCDFGELGQHRQTLATTMTQVFEKGYDLRFGITMAIPVVTASVLTALAWSIKRKYYHKWEWRECIPSDKYKSYRRMQLISKAALCLVDGVDAYIRGGGNPILTLLRMNIVAWLCFIKAIIKELLITYGKDYGDWLVELNRISSELEKQLEELKSVDYNAWSDENIRVKDFNRALELASLEDMGKVTAEFCFESNIKLNYRNVDEFADLLKTGKPLW